MPIRIIYASHACAHVGQREIDDVVEWSQGFNTEHGVTGVLAFDGFQIVQILEGTAEVVEALYGRIQLDTRLEGVVTLVDREIDETHFPDWKMVRRPLANVLMLVEKLR